LQLILFFFVDIEVRTVDNLLTVRICGECTLTFIVEIVVIFLL